MSPDRLPEVEKTLRSWGFTNRTIIFVVHNEYKPAKALTRVNWWARLTNEQKIFNSILGAAGQERDRKYDLQQASKKEITQ